MSERQLPEDVIAQIREIEAQTDPRLLAEEKRANAEKSESDSSKSGEELKENRLDSEARKRVDEISTNLHSVATELNLLVKEKGEDILKQESGKTRLLQARHYINQIKQITCNNVRAKSIVEDAISTVDNSALHRALLN